MRQATALRDYARLESTGRWTPPEGGPPQEVLLSLGEATLILSDLSDRPVSHWSLPALRRVGDAPPTYAPGEGGTETVAVEDAEMNRALSLVIAAAREPRGGAGLARWAGLAALAAVLALAVVQGPDLLRRQAAAALTPAQEEELGRALIARGGGRACSDPLGTEALDRLAGAALGPGAQPVHVLTPGPAGGAAAVPGGIVLSGGAVAAAAGPEALAARLRDVRSAARDVPPVESFLETAGAFELVEVMTTARWPEAALRRHARRIMAAPPPPSGTAGGPVALPDADWVAIKGICAQ